MAARHEIPMLMLHERSARFQEVPHERLTAALPDAQISEPDDLGVFEVAVQADDLEQALQQVWDAVAASGTDDHIASSSIPTCQSIGGCAAAGPAVSEASTEQTQRPGSPLPVSRLRH